MKQQTLDQQAPDSFWHGVPCGHPQDPVAWWGNQGPYCHCGRILDPDRVISTFVLDAPGPLSPCDNCGCTVAIPPKPPPPAVPSEPRRWTLGAFWTTARSLEWRVIDGPPVADEGAYQEVMVEEVGPVSEAQVEAGARAIKKQRHDYNVRRSERSQELFGHPGAAVNSSVPPPTDEDMARAVLSAAREVKSNA